MDVEFDMGTQMLIGPTSPIGHQNPINPSKSKMIAHVHSYVIEEELHCCTPTPFLMSLMFNQWQVELEGWTTWQL
jgi:hypothetical protein